MAALWACARRNQAGNRGGLAGASRAYNTRHQAATKGGVEGPESERELERVTETTADRAVAPTVAESAHARKGEAEFSVVWGRLAAQAVLDAR